MANKFDILDQSFLEVVTGLKFQGAEPPESSFNVPVSQLTIKI